VRVVGQLDALDPGLAHRLGELVEGARLVVRDADPADAALAALALEPFEVLAPEDEVVHLLDVDAAVPVELPPELLASLLDRVGPDLRRDGGAFAPSLERRPEGGLGAAVHGRRVDQAHAGVEGGSDDITRERGVAVERVPGTEAHHGAEPPLLHPGRLYPRRASPIARPPPAMPEEDMSGPVPSPHPPRG
jgi:hypothetical protein